MKSGTAPGGKFPRLPESLERVERCEFHVSALGNETLAAYESGLNLYRVWIPQGIPGRSLEKYLGGILHKGLRVEKRK